MSENTNPTSSQQISKNFPSQFFFHNIKFPLEYLCEFTYKFEIATMVYSGARGKLIHEQNLKYKISCQTPFNTF
jgi:hypothetical protein